MKTSFIYYLAFVAIIASFVYQKWLKEKTLRELYELRNKKDDQAFIEKLDSNFVRFMFNSFTIQFMKLNYWIDNNNDEEVVSLLHHFSKMKLKEADRVALYSKLFGYYIDKKNNAKATNMKNKLVEILENKKDQKSVLLNGEVKQLYAIYVEHDTTMIPDLIETLESMEDNSVKSVLCFRIAKLYHYEKNVKKEKEYLSLAIEYSPNDSQTKSLQELLHHSDKLD